MNSSRPRPCAMLPDTEEILLSIVTITLNDAPGLNSTYQSIRSLLISSNVEWLIKDGGSSHSTLSNQFSIASHADKYIINPDSGIYHAFNEITPYARGHFVLYLNSGDCLTEPASKLIQSDLLRLRLSIPSKLVIVAPTILVLSDKSTFLKQPRTFKSIWHRMPAYHQSIIVTRDLATLIPYPTRYRIHGDYAWLCLISLFSPSLQTLSYPLSIFTYNGLSSTSSLISKLSETAHICTTILKLPIHLTLLSILSKTLANLAYKAKAQLRFPRLHPKHSIPPQSPG